MSAMLTCEGYKMFVGYAEIKYPMRSPRYISGRWLYRPDTGFWYVNGSPDFPWGSSFPAEIVTPEVNPPSD